MHQVVQGQQGADGTAAAPLVTTPAVGRHHEARHVPSGPAAGSAGRPGGQIVVVSAHGGAGASTLVDWLRREASNLPAGRECRVGRTRALPDADPAQIAASSWLRLPPPAIPLIIAARGNAQGARRAVTAVTVLEYRGIWPVAIALVADGAGAEPRQAAQYLNLIGDRAGPVVRVPFVAALRAGALPGNVRMRRGLHNALTGLLALAAPEPARGQPW